MPYFITNGKTPLLMETVPVLKVTNYSGSAKRDNVYTYMRSFAYNGSMFCSFTSFDESPLEGTVMSLVLRHIDSENVLTVTCGKHTAATATLQHNSTCTDMTPCLNAAPVITGGDEQGLYWGVNFEIAQKAFAQSFGTKLNDGEIYQGNLFLHSTEETAFGSAFLVPQGASIPCIDGADSFFIVPY